MSSSPGEPEESRPPRRPDEPRTGARPTGGGGVRPLRPRVAASAGVVLALVATLVVSGCAGTAAPDAARPTTTLVAEPGRVKVAAPTPTPTPTPTRTPTPTPTATAKPRTAAPKPSAEPATKPSPKPAAKPAAKQDKCETTYHGPPFYTSPPTAGGNGKNGNIPPSMMTAVPWAVDSHGTGFWLLTKAEKALVKLDAAFTKRFGHHLDIDLAYRDLATQKAMYKALGPSVAAYPGTSKHGTGLAIDVPEWPCQYGWGTTQRNWLVAHAPTYGWYSPWGLTQSTDAEYWHFEYRG
jgi:LAS superfamily LD-carboxypeptidase LdcB